jgi:hypothetical protein
VTLLCCLLACLECCYIFTVRIASCCFLDAEGLVPPKLLQGSLLLSTCASGAQYSGADSL